ncbi:DHH family phosphoesterase [Lachnobacterium bovis]|uniref:NanoRNase/pAp phosphatase, hydrolyzes c-di-AMP and oligoRNAs n=1 Tax=Lachnobacterium bovis TaxID=140626 RepID=A0A1H9RUU3_9FIRM|nr:DHH family phosphoesterase [Lachnobacterium bovis]SER76630.1 nanoRNase/pAp phosphatase, hydrolyzes c-di-AMP and oligoRNAs [Lachnobacterium bovis]
MNLRELLQYNDIVIQCHDNPDADAISSGMALYEYLKKYNKNVRLVYSGQYKIKKRSLELMVSSLDIPIEYVTKLDNPELLVTVDCQYGEGNVTHFDAQNIAVIDHHQISVKMPELFEVKSNLGSCATLMWMLLKKEGFYIGDNIKLSTALYYGLYTDTNGFTEMDHPCDRDLRDTANFDKALIVKFKNSNLTLNDLSIAGEAINHYEYNNEYKFAIIKVRPCDPNILGLISDIVIEVDKIETCLVYSINATGIKISVRSCSKEVKACELADYICRDIGSGGGHKIKAGGFIQLNLLRNAYQKYCEEFNISYENSENELCNPSRQEISDFLEYKMIDYFLQSEVIYSQKYNIDFSSMKVYKKKEVELGYVRLSDLYESGSSVYIRTFSKDVKINVESGVIIMLDGKGDVWEISEEYFNENYVSKPGKYKLDNVEYMPTVKSVNTGITIGLGYYAKKCVFDGREIVYAKPVEKNVKIFSQDNEDDYILGKKGDYLVIKCKDVRDLSICEKDKFMDSYKRV